MKVVRYYICYGMDRDDAGYYELEDALEDVRLRFKDATEIEKTIWYTEEAYQNREPADEFETVWRKQ